MNAADHATLLVGQPPLAESSQPRPSPARPSRRRGWLVRRALLAADVVGLSTALAVPVLLFGVGRSNRGLLPEIGEYLVFACALPAWVVAAKLYGLYDRDEERTDHSTTDDVAGVFNLVTAISWLLFAAASVIPVVKPSFSTVLVFWTVAIVAIPLMRVAGRAYCRRRVEYVQNAVIVGAGEVGRTIAHKLLQHPEYGIHVVGFVDSGVEPGPSGIAHLANLGEPHELETIVAALDVERVILAFPQEPHARTLELVRELRSLGVQIDVVPSLFEALGASFGVHTVEGLPLIGLPSLHLSRSSLLLKRTLDLTVATLALLVLAPLFLAIAVLIKLDSPGPVFFRQVRVGAGGCTFRIFKFRSMVADADARKAEFRHLNKHLDDDPRMFKIPGDPRITRTGRWLRRFSLDELPQLFNVVRGEMSLVGPRPLILEEDRYVADWGRRRLALKPGITGLWQVLGRSDISFEEMLRLDYSYVTGWTLGNDVRLLFRTIPVLFGSAHAH